MTIKHPGYSFRNALFVFITTVLSACTWLITIVTFGWVGRFWSCRIALFCLEHPTWNAVYTDIDDELQPHISRRKLMYDNQRIVLDFDGTCVNHSYPRIGQEVPGAVTCLRYWNHIGLRIILSTMRSGKELQDAVKWFVGNDIDLYAVQKDPNQEAWTNSPKCDGDICVDDRNAGTPLVQYPSFNRPCVLWDDILYPNSKRVKVYGMRSIVNTRLKNTHVNLL